MKNRASCGALFLRPQCGEQLAFQALAGIMWTGHIVQRTRKGEAGRNGAGHNEMKCRYCGYPDSKVMDSRPIEGGLVIRRRRQCAKCGERFTTYERAEALPVLVIKRDGTRESFSPEKIRRGVIKACEKRPVSLDRIDEVVESVERDVQARHQEEIPSKEIGDMVLSALRPVDQVAYIRFASVYHSFQNVEEFIREIQNLADADSDLEDDGQ